MTNLKDENKRQSNNIKEDAKEFLDNQRQQLENTTSTISETTDQVTDNINEYQRSNNEILDKSIDISNKYQQQVINTIKTISNNYIELQNNILNTYQSVLSKLIDSSSKSWNNFIIPSKYTNVYNKINQNLTDNTTNAINPVNDIILGYSEIFNKSIEVSQKYYNDSVQYYFNFINKVERPYNH